MIDQQSFMLVLLSMATLYLILGIWSSLKVKSLQNYFLANRNLGVFKLTFALIASQLGSGMILGIAYRAYHVGFWGILYAVGMSLGFLILGLGLAGRMRALNINTVAELFEIHYGSYRLKLLASTLSIISLWGILLAQIVASKTLFLGLKITDPYLLISCWMFLIFYSMLGGLNSIVLIDIFQVTFIVVIFLFLFLSSIPSLISFSLPQLKMAQNYFFDVKADWFNFFPLLLIPTLFSLIEQDVAQKFFAAKTKATATISAFLAGIFLVAFSCLPIFFGILARAKHVIVPQGANPLVSVLFLISSKSVFMLVMCAIIAAIASTASSILCAISSNVVQDFAKFLPMDNKSLLVTRTISFLIGIAALIISFSIEGDVLFILENSYRISVICLFVPTIIAYFSRSLSATAAWISIFCAVSGIISVQYFTITAIMKDLTPLSLSFVGYLITHLIVYKKK